MGFSDNLDIEGGSDFLKLVPGGIVTFHILSPQPSKSLIHWENKKKVTCLGKGCELCAKGIRPKQRWVIEVWDRREQGVKKLEFGSMIASQLKSIDEMLTENQQTIYSVDIRIKTMGSGIDTEYSVLHVPMTEEVPDEVKQRYDLEVPF